MQEEATNQAKVVYLAVQKILTLRLTQKSQGVSKPGKFSREDGRCQSKNGSLQEHDEVNAEEGSILPPMKEETLEFGRQLREDGNNNQKEIVWHAEENSCSRYQELQMEGMQIKDRLL